MSSPPAPPRAPRPAARLMRRLLTVGAFGVALAAGATVAGAADSKIVYECAPNLCSIDPETGRTAKVTTDGTTEAPYTEPSLSGDGKHLAAVRGGRALAGKYGDPLRQYGELGHVVAVAAAAKGPAVAVRTSETRRINQPRCRANLFTGTIDCDYLNWEIVNILAVEYPAGVSHGAEGVGFLGDGRLVLSTSEWDDTLRMTRRYLCVVANAADKDSPCAVRAEDPGFRLVDPAGSADSRAIAATAVALEGEATSVRIYDAATGLKTAEFAPGSAQPALSPNGKHVAFTLDGRVHVASTVNGKTKALTAGANPTWAPGSYATTPPATVRSSALRQKAGRIPVKVSCPAGAACRGVIRVQKGKSALAVARYSVKAGRTATLKLKVAARGKKLIARARTHRITVTLTPSVGVAVKRSVTLRR